MLQLKAEDMVVAVAHEINQPVGIIRAAWRRSSGYSR